MDQYLIEKTIRETRDTFVAYEGIARCGWNIDSADAALFRERIAQCDSALNELLSVEAVIERVRPSTLFQQQFPTSKARGGVVVRKMRNGDALIRWDELKTPQALESSFYERMS